MARSKAQQAKAAQADVERALELLRDDPPRLKRLLRDTAGLAETYAEVLEEAEAEDLAGKVRRTAKLLRGGALLPAGMSVALLRKAMERLVAGVG
jgi:hypothetical protein